MAIEKNVGRLDRNIRLAIVFIIAFLYFSGNISGLAAAILVIIGVLLVITSWLNFCPLYRLFGINTRK